MRLINMSYPQVEEYFKGNDTVIFAMGSIENHGKHNPLGVDTLIPERILELVEKKCEVLIIPTLPYGTCEPLMGYAGTISLGPDIYYGVINKIVESMYMYGAKKILFLNGHDMNIPILERVGLEWYDKGLYALHISWWTILPSINPNWIGGHGGAVETSAIMSIDPNLVDLSKVGSISPKNDLSDEIPTCGVKNVKFKGVEIPFNRPIKSISDNGWFGPVGQPDGHDHPKDSTAEYGQEMLEAVADYIAEFTEAFKRVKV